MTCNKNCLSNDIFPELENEFSNTDKIIIYLKLYVFPLTIHHNKEFQRNKLNRSNNIS